MIRFSGFLALCLFLLGCSHSFLEEGDYFHIEKDEAIMPVWIQGNKKSNRYIVFIHGGPGNSAIAEATLDFFNQLETEAAVVYWDQRGAGLSDGNTNAITNELIAEDLDLLIDILHQKFDAQKVILMGHSYGAIISSCYLNNPQRAAKISGWIVIDGTDNLKENWAYSIEWVKREISKSDKPSHWNDVLLWYKSLPSEDYFQSHDEVKRHINYVDSLKGMFHADSNRVSGSGGQIFFSPIGLGMLHNEKECGKRLIRWWESDYSAAMQNITTPLLLLHGKYDGIIPMAAGESLFLNIGTASEQKRMVLFNNSGHHPHYEEKDLFNQEVIDFISNL